MRNKSEYQHIHKYFSHTVVFKTILQPPAPISLYTITHTQTPTRRQNETQRSPQDNISQPGELNVFPDRVFLEKRPSLAYIFLPFTLFILSRSAIFQFFLYSHCPSLLFLLAYFLCIFFQNRHPSQFTIFFVFLLMSFCFCYVSFLFLCLYC